MYKKEFARNLIAAYIRQINQQLLSFFLKISVNYLLIFRITKVNKTLMIRDVPP